MTQEEKKLSFVERALIFLKGGEKANIAAVHKQSIKKWKKQVEQKERLISDIQKKVAEEVEEQNEYLDEAKGDYKESFLNIDSEVKGRDKVISYIEREYEVQIASALAKVESIEAKIEDLKASAEAKVAKLNKEISRYKSFIAELAD